MAHALRRNHRRKFRRTSGGSEESSDAATRPRSARGSPGEHGQDRVVDLATEDRLKDSRYSRGNRRRRHESRRPSAWRKRPHRWPQAWQANRPFRVVAHATGLLLAILRQWRHEAGGTKRRPRITAAICTTTCSCPARLTARQSCSLTRTSPRRRPVRGEHLARSPVPLPVPPSKRYIERVRLRRALRFASGVRQATDRYGGRLPATWRSLR